MKKSANSERFVPFKTVVTESHLAALKEANVYTRVESWEKGWLKAGMTLKFEAPVFVEPYSAQRIGPTFCSMGAFSYSRSAFSNKQTIGRYCAIASSVSVLGVNHPMDRLSMCGFDYSDRLIFSEPQRQSGKFIKKVPVKGRTYRPPVIGNDVWIGEGVTLAQGIRIGNGAVLAARSVVTKDVPDYAIVAGNPARVKKMRFNENLIEKLLSLAWWEYSFTEFGDAPTENVEKFIEIFSEKIIEKKISPYKPPKVALHAIFL